MEIDIKHLKFKHPFTCLVAGPTRSGKTILIKRNLKNYNVLIHNIRSPVKVLWCYGIFQPLLKVPISDNIILQLNEGMPSIELINEFSPIVIVIDDLMSAIDKNKSLENFFTKVSHHLNISIVFSVQNLFYKSIRTISLNSQYIILMKSPRDGQQIYKI